MMPNMKYVILHQDDRLEFVEIPADHAYQLSALLKRLHKEIGKLTASHVPQLPTVAAEASGLKSSIPAIQWSAAWIISMNWSLNLQRSKKRTIRSFPFLRKFALYKRSWNNGMKKNNTNDDESVGGPAHLFVFNHKLIRKV